MDVFDSVIIGLITGISLATFVVACKIIDALDDLKKDLRAIRKDREV